MYDLITHLIFIISISALGASNCFLFDDISSKQQFMWAIAMFISTVSIGLLIMWDCGLFKYYLR